MFFNDAGRLRSMLASWTDVDEPDLFTQAAGGRSFLRADDLAALARLVDEIEQAHKRGLLDANASETRMDQNVRGCFHLKR